MGPDQVHPAVQAVTLLLLVLALAGLLIALGIIP